MTRLRHGWVTAAVVAAVGSVIYGATLGRLTSHFLGREYVDHYGTQWFYWFVQHQLERGEKLGHTNLFFFPYGKDIFGHTGANVLDALIFIPFRVLLGPTLGYNVFVLLGLAATAWAFQRFVRLFTDDVVAVSVSTALMVFTPYVLLELVDGRPTQGILLLPVLFIHAAWCCGIQRGRRHALMGGLLLALCGYQYWFYAFFGGLACLGLGIARVLSPPQGAGTSRQVLGRYVIMASVAVLLCLPVGLPLLGLSGAEGIEVPGLIDTSTWSMRASPPVTMEDQEVGLFLWQPLRHATGFFVLDEMGAERFVLDASYLPWAALPMLALYLRNPGKLHRKPLMAMVAVTVFIALGPLLLIDQFALPNLVYLWLLQLFVFMRRLWWPARAFAFTAIALALAIALGLAALRRYGLKRQITCAVGVVGLWLMELHGLGVVPFPAWADTVPAGYRCLAEDKTEGAIIELPYEWTQAHLYYQTLHGRPIYGGMVEDNDVFTPAGTRALQQDNTFLAQLIDGASTDRELKPVKPDDKAALHKLGFRYVVFQKDSLSVPRSTNRLFDDAIRAQLRVRRKALKKLAGAPIYEDARVAIYAPWGDPSPCDATRIGKDLESVPVGVVQEMRTEPDGNAQLISRLIPALPDAEEAGATDE